MQKQNSLTLPEIYQQFIIDLKGTTLLEYLAVVFGIASVWYSRKESILVYPVGLVNTTIYIYISFKGSLLGEAGVNVYYTVMSIYGWLLWARKDRLDRPMVSITLSTKKQWIEQLIFFTFFYIVIFTALSWLKKGFAPGAIPWADAFASATAFTGMWLMARKKVESWFWWISTNIASIPLYFIKHYVFTSFYYCILLVMAFFGLLEWIRRSEGNKLKRYEVEKNSGNWT